MQAVHPQAAAKDVGESKVVSSPLTVRQEGGNETRVDFSGISSEGISPHPPVESLRITTPKD